MATSRVRHRGHPPRDIDHGPSNGAGQGGAIGAHAEVARLSAYAPSKLVPVGERLEGGAGAIERRQATDAQREAWRREADGPPARSPIEDIPTAVPWHAEPGSLNRMQASRLRGGERNRQLIAATRAPLIHLADPPVTPRPEEPVLSIDPPPPTEDALAVALNALNDASLEAIDAYSNHLIAERRWEQAREALVACYRDTGLLAVQGGYPVGLPEIALPDVNQPRDDADRLAAAVHVHSASETIPPYQRRMLDALVAADGDVPTAAAAIGIKATSLTGTMGRLRKITGLTEAERAVVARKR